MKKAVLYARVSTLLQEKERTIDSQLAELRRQIAKNGDTLVKEYVDNGYSGAYLDRPALDEMREALKTDLFDAVYFLAPDRIARKSVHQDIIIDELLRHKKQVIINDKDYEKNPENEFALKIFGAVSEFERAKIMERTRRGRLHMLRNGRISAQGQIIYGYTYVRKTPESPQKFVINEEEAAIIRGMFEQYGSGSIGLLALTRSLEQRKIKPRKGGQRWYVGSIRKMLANTTYAGVRYFNRLATEETPPSATRKKRGKLVLRDKSEWIPVKVPAIVSQRLFDKVQERLKKARELYHRPREAQLLKGLLKCGECGRSYCSVRAYWKMKRPTGKEEVRHWVSYQCTTKYVRHQHDRSNRRRCYNARITAYILEDKVMQLVRDIILNPDKLSAHVHREDLVSDVDASRELAMVAEKIRKLEETRHQLINGYSMGRTTNARYVARNHAIDLQLKRFQREKAKIIDESTGKTVSLEKRLKQFCMGAQTQLEECVDLESRRLFLNEIVEKTIFNHGRLTILGSIKSYDETVLPYRIESEIDDKRTRIYANLPPQAEARSERGISRRPRYELKY